MSFFDKPAHWPRPSRLDWLLLLAYLAVLVALWGRG